MRKVLFGCAVVAALLGAPAGSALAAANPSGTGQPTQSCEDPGMVMPHGFTTSGFANAAAHYAGSDGTGSLNSGNAHAVSQYDVACFRSPAPVTESPATGQGGKRPARAGRRACGTPKRRAKKGHPTESGFGRPILTEA